MGFNSYHPPFLLNNGHLQTIFPVLFRKNDCGFYRSERIRTQDDDFLDLDWSPLGSSRLVILSHGLEGSSKRAYVTGMVKALNRGGMDALAWNYRSCSGEPNLRLRSYHNGATEDLIRVIDHAKATGRYKEIYLLGFSLGGNLSLVYLGRERVEPLVKKAVVFSVPCDLKSSAEELAKPVNRLYMKRFLIMLHGKIKAKMKQIPGRINDADFHRIKSFQAFDERYTAPIHGFKSAEDYWKQCSSLQFVKAVNIPTLIVNAKNDPFLTKSCYPVDQAGKNPNIHLEMPDSGGHVGFVEFNGQDLYWSEKRAVAFFNSAE